MTGTVLDALTAALRGFALGDEAWTLALHGEDSLFIRFNHGRVRQAGEVHELAASLRWIAGDRAVVRSFTLAGAPDEDVAAALAEAAAARAAVAVLPPDPHLLGDREGRAEERLDDTPMPTAEDVVATVVDAAAGLDLVGFFQAGEVIRAYASSFGHRALVTRRTWAFEFTTVASDDRADKRAVAGTTWEPQRVRDAIRAAADVLPVLRRPAVTVPPGAYRAWLAPAAVAELVELLGGFGDLGGHAVHTRVSAIGRLVRGEVALDPRVQWTEDVAALGAVPFQGDGFQRPARTPLIADGRYAGCLVAPRTGLEHGVPHTGADPSEAPVALSMAPGDLPDAGVLAALGTGVWISNLWYLNYADRQAGRVTGMTRFATLWVEDGVPVGPLSVMRFDDDVLALLGERLVAIGANAPLMPSLDTYGSRSTRVLRVPGVLVDGLRFTL